MPKKEKKADSFLKKIKGLDDHAFTILLILFVLFSGYTMVSFYLSTGNQIDLLKADLLLANERDREARETILLSGDSLVETNETLSDNIHRGVFPDVGEDTQHAHKIENLYDRGVIKGYQDGYFRPDQVVSRAEFWVMLNKAIDADFGGMQLENCFEDVKNEWFAADVCFAKEKGFIAGYDGNFYRPYQPVNKAEATKMIVEALGLVLPVESEIIYGDVDLDDWFLPYANVAAVEGFYEQGDTFSPDYNLRRGDVAGVIYNVLN
ncbi:hypothetical protein CVV38_03945 [Candidatus Peregrinibacteria bacterium HGW-Peregrinibacteria-1]|jgi:hypothetical protein|nr:MAG: hypothetical protein CVV38_03945 [Candidatus Peregrinibacteria bacterium HGW-Peregrinibacteria-1]